MVMVWGRILGIVIITVITVVSSRDISKRVKYLNAWKELRWCRKQEPTESIWIKELILEAVLQHKRTCLKCILIKASAIVSIVLLADWLYKYGFQFDCALIIALLCMLLGYAGREVEASEKRLTDPYVCLLEFHKDARERMVISALEPKNEKQSINLDKLMVSVIIQRSCVKDKHTMFKGRKGYVWLQKEKWWFGNQYIGSPFDVEDMRDEKIRVSLELRGDTNKR